MTPDELSDRLLKFAVRTGKVVDALPNTRMGNHIAGQLIRCGTSPLPNYEEACGAESRKDFAHKMRVCLKELRESRAWLRLIVLAQLLSDKKMADIVDESEQLSLIFGKAVLTARTAATARKSRSTTESR